MRKNVLRVDCKKVFPNPGLVSRMNSRDLTSATIVARCKKHGRVPLAKHSARAEFVTT